MKSRASSQFDKKYAALPEAIRKKIKKQTRFLIENLRHPSLRAKKYDETKGIWQARVDRHYRFYFMIEGDTYILTNITKHTD